MKKYLDKNSVDIHTMNNSIGLIRNTAINLKYFIERRCSEVKDDEDIQRQFQTIDEYCVDMSSHVNNLTSVRNMSSKAEVLQAIKNCNENIAMFEEYRNALIEELLKEEITKE